MEANNPVTLNPVSVNPTVGTVTVSPVPAPQTTVNSALTPVQYAGFGSRFLASIIDAVIILTVNFVVGFVIGFILGLAGMSSDTSLLSTVKFILNMFSYAFSFFYYIYFIGAKGQTPGKMIMKVKVVKASDSSVPGLLSAFLREAIGKFLSSIAVLLGYFWMLWDPKKQTWHDKIAGTIVVKV